MTNIFGGLWKRRPATIGCAVTDKLISYQVHLDTANLKTQSDWDAFIDAEVAEANRLITEPKPWRLS